MNKFIFVIQARAEGPRASSEARIARPISLYSLSDKSLSSILLKLDSCVFVCLFVCPDCIKAMEE